jgi:hypothetical protein
VTDGPPVTITDPRAAPAPLAAPTSPWTRAERVLATAASALLVVALASAHHLSPGTPDGGLSADAVSVGVTLDRPAVLTVDVVLRGDTDAVHDVRAIHPDGGWVLVGQVPGRVGGGVRLSVSHPVVCDVHVTVPSRLRLDVPGRSLEVRVRARHGTRLSPCDPLRGGAAVHVLTSSLTRGRRTAVSLGLGNVSTRPVTLASVSFGGFSFASTRPLPVLLPGRDRSRPLDLGELDVVALDLVADVQQCGIARHALDGARTSRTPDRLATVVDGRAAAVEVRGLVAYLELQWRATCVR